MFVPDIRYQDMDRTVRLKILGELGLITECPHCSREMLVKRRHQDPQGLFLSCSGWRPKKQGCCYSKSMDASAEARIVELAKTRPECSARKTNGNKPLIDPVESPRTAAAYDPVKLVDEIRQHKARIAQLEADSAAKDELILRLRKSA